MKGKMRDIKKQAEQGRKVIKKHPGADLSLNEVAYFMDEFEAAIKAEKPCNAIMKVVYDAFLMGVAIGRRNA